MKHLTLEQRYALKAYFQYRVSKTEIAKRLGVHKSTIYRELQRNQRKKGAYNPDFAQELSEERKERFGDWGIDLIVGKNNKGAMVTSRPLKQHLSTDIQKISFTDPLIYLQVFLSLQ